MRRLFLHTCASADERSAIWVHKANPMYGTFWRTPALVHKNHPHLGTQKSEQNHVPTDLNGRTNRRSILGIKIGTQGASCTPGNTILYGSTLSFRCLTEETLISVNMTPRTSHIDPSRTGQSQSSENNAHFPAGNL